MYEMRNIINLIKEFKFDRLKGEFRIWMVERNWSILTENSKDPENGRKNGI